MSLGLGLGLGLTLNKGVGVNRTALYAIGDSTAAGDGSDTTAGKIMTILAGDAGLTLVNNGVSGQDIADCLTGVQADGVHRNWVTVLRDNINTGETASGWLSTVAQIVALQPNILIWPQVGVTNGSQDAPTLAACAAINSGIIANWPSNTFDATEQAALIAALSNANTRADGLHRNDIGQAVEALFASGWMVRKGWRATRPEAAALIARMTGAPTAKRQSYINALVERHVFTGLWPTMDGYWCEAAADEQAADLNWVSSNYGLTKTGTVSFVADQGHTGDGSTGYMSTGFNPASAIAPQFGQNSANLHLYHLTTPAESKRDIASTTITSGSSALATRNADNSLSYQLNNASTQFGSGGVTGPQSHDLTRRDSANLYPAVNQGELTGLAVASVAPAGGVVLLGGTTFNTKQRAFASIGGAITAEMIRRRYNSETAWLKALGAAV